MPRPQLLAALTGGKVDLVMAQVNVTPELEKLIAFTIPTRSNVAEIVVTGPGAPSIATVDDLAGQEVFVRKHTVYAQSLLALNERLKAAGKPPVVVQPVPENLEDDDVLEMVNAGLIKITVVDDYLAKFWKQVFTNLTVHDTVAVRTGGNLAVAIRKNNPDLAAELNAFIARYGLGSAFGNMMQKRYLQNTRFVKNAASDTERKKLEAVAALFKKYGDQYQVDYLLMVAQGYQESTLDQNVRSQVGAVGVMQVMPATGQDLKVGDITAAGAQHPRRREVLPLHDGSVLQGRADGPAQQGALHLRVVQRRARTHPTAPARGGHARPRSQRLVRQRGTGRLGAHRPRDGDLREQHLQVLRGLQDGHGRAGAARLRESGAEAGERQVADFTPERRTLGDRLSGREQENEMNTDELIVAHGHCVRRRNENRIRVARRISA